MASWYSGSSVAQSLLAAIRAALIRVPWKGLNTHRPPKGDRSEEFDFFPQNPDLCISAHNLNFGLSEIVEGTFLKFPMFHQNFEFLNFRPDFFLWKSKSWYFELILWVFDCMLGVWTCILGVWPYTLGVWTCIPCVGCLNLYFWASEDQAFWGLVNLEILKDQAFWYDLWMWKYWRTSHSGMTCESGNTEGLEPVDFRPISRPWDWNAWAPRPFGPGLVPC